MKSYKKPIQKLISMMEKNKILTSVSRIYNFPDSPSFPAYGVGVTTTSKLTDGTKRTIDGYGTTYRQQDLALYKALCESLERLAQVCYKNRDIVHSSFQNLKENAIDPYLFINKKNIRNKEFGWIRGYNLAQNTPTLIPTQMVYLDYINNTSEPILNDINTTGAAAGTDHESTLLNALYEVVERDTFMTMYLTKIPGKRIAVEKIKSNNVKLALNSVERYNYELFLFDITNDLEIPTYLSILVDKTGIGGCVSLGTKSSFSQIKAIEGSIRESFAGDKWLRAEVIENGYKSRPTSPNKISSIKDRGLYWYPISMLKHLNYLFEQKSYDLKIKEFKDDPKKELKKIVKIFAEKKIEVFVADLTLSIYKEVNLKVYKAIIPALQMLILSENNVIIKHARLKEVSKYFGHSSYSLNRIPQPFL